LIKLIIFDLDGVLIDMKDLHYEALNGALRHFDQKYVIGREEHLSTYDGRPTTAKLKLLTKNKGLPKKLYDEIWKRKQRETLKLIDRFDKDERLCRVLWKLKDDGLVVCVATNSIRETAKLSLLRKGFMEYIDFFYSNQDVRSPKPSTEMFLRCMIKAGVSPSETLIIEDSHIGRKTAIDSGAHLLGVKDSDSVTYEAIKNKIDSLADYARPKWQGGKMSVLIPMAGAGSRFEKAGYTFPKPLIEVHGKPMIQVVVENLNIDARHIFIVQKSHYEKYNLKYLLNLIAPKCKIVQVDGVTEGAACTTLLAKKYIDNDEPLLIANSDQYIEWDSNEFMYSMGDKVDGGILTFKSCHPRWSFVRLNEDGFVIEVAEKRVISTEATCGIYHWARGSDYVKYAERMIGNDTRVNGEFYVAETYNEALLDRKKIKPYHLSAGAMHGIGTPEDLAEFQNYININKITL